MLQLDEISKINNVPKKLFTLFASIEVRELKNYAKDKPLQLLSYFIVFELKEKNNGNARCCWAGSKG